MFKDKTYQKMIQDYGHILEEKIYPEMVELQTVYDDKRNEIGNKNIKYWIQFISRPVLLVATYVCYFGVNKYFGIGIFIVYCLITRQLSKSFRFLSNIVFGCLVIGLLLYALLFCVLDMLELFSLTIDAVSFIFLFMGLPLLLIIEGELIKTIPKFGDHPEKFDVKFFKRKLKGKVIPYILEALGNIVYSPSSTKQIINKKLLNEHNLRVSRLGESDAFYGNRKGVEFGILEDSLSKLVICLQLNKNIKEQVLVTSKNSETLLEKMTRNKIALEDVDFNNEYSVYCNDEVEARYALTPSFIKRLKNLRLNLKAECIVCSMKDDKIIFIVNKNEDLFEIKYSTKGQVSRSSATKTFLQLASIMLMIDHFKLDEKTGL